MKTLCDLTYERASELVRYDPETGILTWAKSRGGHIKEGKIAGCRRKDGYWVVRLDGVLYLVHRVAWLLTKGEWPKLEIDHRDGDPSNNRWKNFRESTHPQNITNQAAHKDNKLGLKGVQKKKNGRFYVRVADKGFGGYPSAEEATAAFAEKAKSVHGEFLRQ